MLSLHVGLRSISPGTYEFTAELNFDGEPIDLAVCEQLIVDAANLADGDSTPNWVGFTLGTDGPPSGSVLTWRGDGSFELWN